MATGKVMERTLLAKGLKKFGGTAKLKGVLSPEASRRAEKHGIPSMKEKTVTGQFNLILNSGVSFGKENGKTKTKAESGGRPTHKIGSAPARGSVSVKSSNGSSGQGVRSRRSRASGRNGSPRISLTNQTNNLVLPHESAL